MMNPELSGPKCIQLFGPVIEALKVLGGSARPAEVRDQIAEAQQAAPPASRTGPAAYSGQGRSRFLFGTG